MDYYAALAHFCAYRERCTQEVREKFLSIKGTEEEWEGIVGRLREENFLDDHRYACSYARGKFRMNHWGRNRIKLELRKSGISATLIENALREINEEDYRHSIEVLINKKLKELTKESPLHCKLKLFRYLIQKGFEQELLQEIIALKMDESK